MLANRTWVPAFAGMTRDTMQDLTPAYLTPPTTARATAESNGATFVK